MTDASRPGMEMAKSPFSTVVELAQPPRRLLRWNWVLGALLGASHVVPLVLTVLLVDLLLWDGRISFEDPAVRDYVSDLVGDAPRVPSSQDAGIVPTVVHSRGTWTEPLLRGAYRNLPWTRATGSYLVGLLTCAFLVGLSRLALIFLQRRTAAAASASVAARLQREVFLRDFAGRDAAGVDAAGSQMSELLRAAIPAVERGFAARMELLPREPVRVAFLVGFASALNLWLGATFVLIAALVWLIGSIALREAAAFGQGYAKAYDAATARLAGLAEKTRLILGYAAADYFQRIYEERLAAATRIDRRRLEFESWFGPVWGAAGLASALALVGLASQNILADRLGLSGAAGVVGALAGVAWSGLEFFWRRGAVAEGASAARKLHHHLLERDVKAPAEGTEFLPPLKKGIEFVNVYCGDGRLALRGFDAALGAGRRTALLSVDPTQSRIVVDLLNRFVDPGRGAVLFDGRDVRNATFESLRAQVCLVLRDELLFPDTVAQNIGCGDPGFSRERIVEAAKQAHAHQFVERLPKGYDCVVGDEAYPLSLGERFRIGLARAILRDPPVVVIEDPDEPLDRDSAHLIDDAIRAFLVRRTCLLVPTRWATLRLAENVIVLDGGRAVATGAHAQLFAESPLYRYLLSTRIAELPRAQG